MTVAITRTEHTATELRRQAARAVEPTVTRRLLALAMVLDGQSRADAARAAGMDRQTLCDWVHRYNADGLQGLGNRHAGGIKPRLSAEQEAEVASWIRRGPDLAVDGVVRWRRVDIEVRIARLFGVALHERSVGKLLTRLGFARLSTRPRHPKVDAAAQASFRPRSAPS